MSHLRHILLGSWPTCATWPASRIHVASEQAGAKKNRRKQDWEDRCTYVISSPDKRNDDRPIPPHRTLVVGYRYVTYRTYEFTWMLSRDFDILRLAIIPSYYTVSYHTEVTEISRTPDVAKTVASSSQSRTLHDFLRYNLAPCMVAVRKNQDYRFPP